MLYGRFTPSDSSDRLSPPETALRLFAGIAGPPFRIPKISCGRAAAYSSTLTVSFAVTLGYTFTSTS